MSAAIWIRRLAFAGVLLCLAVVVLGAYVRLTAAGLGCPDWPGCYGHFIPNGPIDLGKAWREMAHRYAAGTLGVLIVGIAALAIGAGEKRPVSVGFALALVSTVIVQGMLGMLTVTWQLKPLVVTLHLLFGLTTLAMLWWLYLALRSGAPGSSSRTAVSDGPATRRVRFLVMVGFAALGLQIALGGWTSSNYAAIACPDFPTCQNAWWPETDYGNAFVLWRGLGINYEGGVLEHPARVAIHLTHRLGAILASVALLIAALAVLGRAELARARGAAIALISALALQLAIGVLMVLEGFPLSLATAHNGGAALLVLAMILLYRQLGERA